MSTVNLPARPVTPSPPPAANPLPAAPEGSSGLVAEVFRRYPAFSYLLAIPEVRDLLIQAVTPGSEFSPDAFAAALYATNWYRNTQAAVREWDARWGQDPASGQADMRARGAEIRDIAGEAGLSLTSQQVDEYAFHTLRFGISTSSSEFRDGLALLIPDFRSTTPTVTETADTRKTRIVDDLVNDRRTLDDIRRSVNHQAGRDPNFGVGLNAAGDQTLIDAAKNGDIQPLLDRVDDVFVNRGVEIATYGADTGTVSAVAPAGQFGLIYAEVKKLARDYLMPLSDRDAWDLARQVFAGDVNLEGLAVTWGQQARGRSVSLGAAIDRGLTPAQFYAPVFNAVANELEVSVDSLDPMDPQWSQLLGPGEDGEPMSLWEAQRFARSRPEWRNTRRANDEGATLTRTLVEQFGKAVF